MTLPTVQVDIDFTTDLSAGLAYFERVAYDGPYVWHRLQETGGTSMADASGNGFTGTISGTYTLNQTTGKPVTGETASRYVIFDAAGAGISFSGPAFARGMTVEAWVYQPSFSGTVDFYTIVKNLGDFPEATWFSFYTNGDRKLGLGVGNRIWMTDAACLTAATWHHVAATVTEDATTVFYVDGAVVASSVSVGNEFEAFSISNIDRSWLWGRSSVSSNALPIGRIAEPAIYLEALPASAIIDHYQAATNAEFTGYTWTDVTEYVLATQGITRRFGRQSSIEEVTPMELSYVLVNDDRRFEFGYAASPYSNLEPGRPTRVRLTYNAVTYDWAFGFIEDFPQSWDESGTFGRVQIVAHDFIEQMNQTDLRDRRFVEQASGTRMTILANLAGVPVGSRDIDAGAFDVLEQTLTGGTAGDHARQVARTDRGLMYFDGRGYMVFQDGDYRTTDTRATTSQGTLGRSGSDDIVTLGAPEFHSPTKLILNEVTLRRPGGVDQTVGDAGSRLKYGKRSHSDELLLTTDAAVATRAAALLADYKDPLLRVRSIRFNPARGNKWVDALGVQLSDRYTWQFHPQQGWLISRDVFVEGVEDRWVGAEYVATWFLSPAPLADVVAGSFRGLLALTS